MERVADYIIRRLVQENIDKIFLVTGRGILYLTDAVAKNPDMEGVSLYHEQGVSYAAAAYALARDSMGACLVSTGCAAANALTAALCAWQDNLPCVFISGQHMLRETTRHTGLQIRTYGSQEADIISMAAPITKFATMLERAEDVVPVMEKAIHIANEGRKGPVWIDVPLDVQNMRLEPETFPQSICRDFSVGANIGEDVKQVALKLEEARRPLLFVGGGVRSAGAQEVVRDFSEKYDIPVVFSSSGADAIGTGHLLSIGAVGSLGGSRAGNFAVQNADYLLVLGSKLCSQTVGTQADRFAREAEVTVVDIDEAEHKKDGVCMRHFVNADIKFFMEHLSECRLNIQCTEWAQKCFHWKEAFAVSKETFLWGDRDKKIDLYHFADMLSEMLGDDATVITDAGFEELVIPAVIRFKNGQRCLFPAAQGAMGYAIPAIVGAYYAGRKNIVAVIGDGSVMMNIQELQIIRWHDIPAKIFVINNNMYAVIRKRQKDMFRKRTIGNDPSDGVPAPDFAKIAECFSITYRRIEGEENLHSMLEDVLQMKSSCLCEVICRWDQPYLHESYAINQERRLVKRPIEDLAPFLERDIFLEEMIVEPIKE